MDTKEYLFDWNKIPGDDEGRLIEFLKQNFLIDWGKTVKIEKAPNNNAIRVYTENNSLSLRLNNEKTRIVLTVDDGRIDELAVEMKNDKLNISKKAKVLGPGKHPVGRKGIIMMMSYLMLFSLLLLYSIARFWPPPTSAEVSVTMSEVNYLLWKFSMLNETRLLIIVVLAGALGSVTHALRSFYWYVGNRDLIWSWLTMYFLLPFSGATLGLVFYLIIRGGFFSPQATVQEINPFGFIAVSALVGLFSVQAVLKLKEVADTLLTKAPAGEDSEPQETKMEKG